MHHDSFFGGLRILDKMLECTASCLNAARRSVSHLSYDRAHRCVRQHAAGLQDRTLQRRYVCEAFGVSGQFAPKTPSGPSGSLS